MKLIFAPMATLSHAGMRQIIDKFGGCDEYYTEMIHATSFIHGSKFEPYYSMSCPAPQKLVWQLTDCNADKLSECAAILMEEQKPRWRVPENMQSGDKRAIGIDINMGCSAPDIFKFGSGIAWMSKPLNEVYDMLHKVRGSFKGRLSCKIRLGEDTHDKVGFSETHFYEYLDMLIESGVTQIVLHPRTRREKTSRPPRYKYIEDAALYVHKKALEKNTNISFIGNGNVASKDDYNKYCKICPDADGLMIARAAVQKPWIFSQIANTRNCELKSPLEIDLYDLAVSFIDNLRKYQPEEFYKTRAQRFFTYFCDNFSFATHIKNQILNAKTLDKTLFFLEEYFTKMPNERFV
ncbi:MAG: hypothetical protein BKP49_08195 [Treponema sp. CETP13]|nr:MAG: hypothetical protein BKP49_08195 [Treponema sp. CETP13]